MSATVTAERTVDTQRRLRYAISDGWVLTKRNLITYVRKSNERGDRRHPHEGLRKGLA